MINEERDDGVGRHSKPEESTTPDNADPTTEGRHAAHSSEASPAGEIRSTTNSWGELDG